MSGTVYSYVNSLGDVCWARRRRQFATALAGCHYAEIVAHKDGSFSAWFCPEPLRWGAWNVAKDLTEAQAFAWLVL